LLQADDGKGSEKIVSFGIIRMEFGRADEQAYIQGLESTSTLWKS
jgi:hypothetical protein